MIMSNAIGVEPTHEKRKLHRLTRHELQTLTVNKYNFDQDFPEHSRLIDSSEFWRIATRKTFDKLSAPPSMDEGMSTSSDSRDFSSCSK